MKTLFNASATVLFLGVSLLVSSLAVAQQTGPTAPYYEEKTFESAVFPAAAPAKMWVHIAKKAINRSVTVELLNQRGQVIASEWYGRRQPVVCTRFDLSQIGDGVYTFRISDGQQTQERTFKLATPGFEEQLPKRLITLSESAPGASGEMGKN